jgi:hypothetical protein
MQSLPLHVKVVRHRNNGHVLEESELPMLIAHQQLFKAPFTLSGSPTRVLQIRVTVTENEQYHADSSQVRKPFRIWRAIIIRRRAISLPKFSTLSQ